MQVQTTRFGMVEVADDRVIFFPAGLLGFSAFKRYALLQPDEDAAFLWLQSLDTPELAFVVTDPSLWVPGYDVPIRREQVEEMELASLEDAQVLVIVNKRDRMLTANLQGPILINAVTCVAQQLVLAEKRWTTRHEIFELAPEARAMSA